jgi:AraC-like DNA-binding protein
MPVMDGLEMCKLIRKQQELSTTPIIMLTAKDDKRTEERSIELEVNVFIPKPFDAELLLMRINQLLATGQKLEKKVRLQQIAEPKTMEARSWDEKFLSDITGIIEDKIADADLNVNRLSELSGISSKQIYRRIKQLTGLSPVDYIRSIRLKKAAMLLSQQKFTVAEVMYLVGFSNYSYFSKCFQAKYGSTPKQYSETKAGE